MRFFITTLLFLTIFQCGQEPEKHQKKIESKKNKNKLNYVDKPKESLESKNKEFIRNDTMHKSILENREHEYVSGSIKVILDKKSKILNKKKALNLIKTKWKNKVFPILKAKKINKKLFFYAGADNGMCIYHYYGLYYPSKKYLQIISLSGANHNGLASQEIDIKILFLEKNLKRKDFINFNELIKNSKILKSDKKKINKYMTYHIFYNYKEILSEQKNYEILKKILEDANEKDFIFSYINTYDDLGVWISKKFNKYTGHKITEEQPFTFENKNTKILVRPKVWIEYLDSTIRDKFNKYFTENKDSIKKEYLYII